MRVVYVETSAGELWRRNRERERPVPAAAIERMLESWTIADASEAHEIVTVLG